MKILGVKDSDELIRFMNDNRDSMFVDDELSDVPDIFESLIFNKNLIYVTSNTSRMEDLFVFLKPLNDSANGTVSMVAFTKSGEDFLESMSNMNSISGKRIKKFKIELFDDDIIRFDELLKDAGFDITADIQSFQRYGLYSREAIL